MSSKAVRRLSVVVAILVCLASESLLAAGNAPPLSSWSAPASYTPRHSRGGLLTEADISGPVPFIPISPCRQYNSLSATPLLQGVNRNVTLTGAPCGILANAIAVSVNITIFNIIGATGNATFKVDTVSPPAVAWINYPPSEAQRANAGVVSLNASGQIVVQVAQGAGQIDFVVDVNGYYMNSDPTHTLNANEGFTIAANYPDNPAISAYNSALGTGASTGVFGVAQASDGIGVWGKQNGQGWGVFGISVGSGGNGIGVFGKTNTGTDGVFGRNLSDASNTHGVRGVSGPNGGAFAAFDIEDPSGVTGIGHANGVLGISQGQGTVGVLIDSAGTAVIAEGGLGGSDGSSPGIIFGAGGQLVLASAANGSAGVVGIGSGGPASVYTTFVPGGLVGHAGPGGASGRGVLGLSDSLEGVQGRHLSSGSTQTTGSLGCNATDAVCGTGNLSITGTKSFVEPHPTDASKVIKYVAIEGPRPDTYFRGTGHVSGGKAVIHVPDDFRMVTSEAGLTVHLTPVGALATLAVESQDLNHVVVLGSKDVTFHYLVQGARRGYEDWATIQDGIYYKPDSPEDRWPAALSAEQKARLVANGTFNADGTVNMETARRLGWVAEWEKAKKASASTPAFFGSQSRTTESNR